MASVNGIHAVIETFSAIGQYGRSWWASVARPPASLYSAWSCHTRRASTPSSSPATCPMRWWNVSGRTSAKSSHRFMHWMNDCS